MHSLKNWGFSKLILGVKLAVILKMRPQNSPSETIGYIVLKFSEITEIIILFQYSGISFF